MGRDPDSGRSGRLDASTGEREGSGAGRSDAADSLSYVRESIPKPPRSPDSSESPDPPPPLSSQTKRPSVQSVQEPGDRALREILEDLSTYATKYLVLGSRDAVVAWSLWTVHTHTIDRFDTTPRLVFSSTQKGSGKTRALEVTETTSANPVRAADLTAPTLYRLIESRSPTLLLDEYDVLFRSGSETGEAVRGVSNAGYRRGNPVLRCMPPDFKEVKEFETFAPTALAGNGDPPETILDRAVVIRLRKRKPSEPVARWRRATSIPEGYALRDRIAEWASGDWQPVYPDDEPGIQDRLLDVWEPLLAIADAAGGSWPSEARDAVVALSMPEGSESLVIRLLREIRQEWPGGREWISTQDLILRLHSIEDGPWTPGGPFGERGLTPHRLARYLEPFGVKSSHNVQRSARGYLHCEFLDPWERYLPAIQEPGGPAEEPTEPANRPSPEETLREQLGSPS